MAVVKATNGKEVGEFTKHEAEFLGIQIACRKDHFMKEAEQGIRSVERLGELHWIIETLTKAEQIFINIMLEDN